MTSGRIFLSILTLSLRQLLLRLLMRQPFRLDLPTRLLPAG